MELKRFIYRAAVLSQYRQFLRVAKQLPLDGKGCYILAHAPPHPTPEGMLLTSFAFARPGSLRSCALPLPTPSLTKQRSPPSSFLPSAEVTQQIRGQFEASRGAKDLDTVKFLLSEGRLRLKQLSEMIGLSSTNC